MTTFLAGVLGWYLVIFSCMLLFRRKLLTAVFDDLFNHKGSVFIIAVITVILGLMLVLSHNIWVAGWPVVVTLLGWMILISGLLRMFFLESFMHMGKNFQNHATGMTITGIITLLVGLFLLFHVYMML